MRGDHAQTVALEQHVSADGIDEQSDVFGLRQSYLQAERGTMELRMVSELWPDLEAVPGQLCLGWTAEGPYREVL